MIVDAILDAAIDCLKLLPFLFLTYLFMELLEKKEGERLQNKIKRAGKSGPIWGSIVGVVPQCGFSAAASSLYAGRVITVGTLFAVFLSTSDEMLPVFLSQAVPITTIAEVLLGKVVIAIISGFIIEFILGKYLNEKEQKMDIHTVCEHEHCDCHQGVLVSAIKHTVKIAFFILIISALLNTIIGFVGEDALSAFMSQNKVLSVFVAAIVGLIPNCAASVALAQMYLKGMIGVGAMMAGLLVGAGVGLLILIRLNKKKKENALIVGTLYLTGVIWGLLISFLAG